MNVKKIYELNFGWLKFLTPRLVHPIYEIRIRYWISEVSHSTSLKRSFVPETIHAPVKETNGGTWLTFLVSIPKLLLKISWLAQRVLPKVWSSYAVVFSSDLGFGRVVPHMIDPLGDVSGLAWWYGRGSRRTYAGAIRETRYAPLATLVVILTDKPPP